MKKYYVNLENDNEVRFSKIKTKGSFECHVKKVKSGVLVAFHPICSYLDELLFIAAKNNWKEKLIRVCYDENVSPNLVVFSGFKGSAFD